MVGSSLSLQQRTHILIVQECLSLEGKLNCHGATDNVLNSKTAQKEIKKSILIKVDWETCLSEATQHNSTAVAASIYHSASWLRLWDMALDHGPRGTAALQALYRRLTRPRIGDLNVCSICKTELSEYFEHYTHSAIHPFITQNSSSAVLLRGVQKFLTMQNTLYNLFSQLTFVTYVFHVCITKAR